MVESSLQDSADEVTDVSQKDKKIKRSLLLIAAILVTKDLKEQRNNLLEETDLKFDDIRYLKSSDWVPFSHFTTQVAKNILLLQIMYKKCAEKDLKNDSKMDEFLAEMIEFALQPEEEPPRQLPGNFSRTITEDDWKNFIKKFHEFKKDAKQQN